MRSIAWICLLTLAQLVAHTGEGVTFSQHVKPFISDYCLECHNPQKAKGDLTLDKLTGDFSKPGERTIFLDMLNQLDLGDMPPEKAKKPTAHQMATVMAWLRSELKRTKSHTAQDIDKRQLPGYGNYVNHTALFTPTSKNTAATPVRLWRINPYIYRMRLIELLGTNTAETKERDPVRNQGNDGLNPAFAIDTSHHDFSDFSILYGFESNTTELLLTSAYDVASLLAHSNAITIPNWYQQSRSKKDDVAKKNGPAPTRADVGTFLALIHDHVLDRSLSISDKEKYLSLYDKTCAIADWRSSVQTVIAAVLTTPEAVFKCETGSGPTDAHGRRLLAPMQMANALGYALLDSGPDPLLLKAANEGQLTTRDGIRSQLTRLVNVANVMLYGSQIKHLELLPETGPVLRFFREYFEYAQAKNIFKDPNRKPFYNNDAASAAVNELDNLVRWVLEKDSDVFRTLLTSEKTFVDYDYFSKGRLTNPKRTTGTFIERRRSYLIYGFDENWKWTEKQPVSFPANQRKGILTHPAWLIAFSDNEKNHAIQRGRWVTMKLLGGVVPDAPITVNAQLPEDDGKTSLRERMHVTKEPYCWKCHSKMDPYGLPFEQYDFYGYYRTKEYDKPVDTSGRIDIGDKELDGPVSSPFEMIDRIANSRRAKQVFIRHAFRFFIGRNETLEDAPTLIEAEKAYDDSKGSMKALLISLLSSDSFIYRRLAATTVSTLEPKP